MRCGNELCALWRIDALGCFNEKCIIATKQTGGETVQIRPTADIKPQPFVLKDGENADEFSIIPPSLLEEAERNIKLIQAVRLLTEAIALSQISGENTKAQMRDKIIKAREIIEELKRQK